MNIQRLLAQVINISKQAGKIIKQEISENDFGIEKKGTNDFVTSVDKACEELIIRHLEPLIPGAGFIAEENEDLEIGEEYNWIIDPIDGTTNFIHGFFPCAVSIGLKKGDEIILGVIHEVGLDEFFYATKDGGAFLNGEKIKVSEKLEFSDALLATGFPYNEFQPLDKFIDLLKHLTKTTQGIRRLGSAATDMAYVACGRFDGFYEYDLKPYDVAAGIVIVKEAGGKICDFKGGDDYLFGKEIIVSNSNIFKAFKKTVSDFMNI